jgi:hypothetical protein
MTTQDRAALNAILRNDFAYFAQQPVLLIAFLEFFAAGATTFLTKVPINTGV